jgi:prepilin-type N-terminal cleavage/methylation domain-containing protein
MIRLRLPSQGRHRPPIGFTLTELMVTVAVIGILSGITISTSLNNWRDAQVSDLTLQLAGWLEQISRSPETLNPPTSCTVTFASGITGGITLSNGALLASVSPTACSPEPSFTVSTRFGSQQISAAASAASVVFTPRNAITSSTDIQVRLALLGQAPVRCVRLSAVLGLIRSGRNDASSSVTTACPAASFDTL